MKNSKLLLSTLGILALGASSLASAQSDSYGRWNDSASEQPDSWIPGTSYGYLGANVGESDFDLGGCAAGFTCENNDVGFKVYTGGKINRIIGVELAYVNPGVGKANGGKQKVQAANLSLVGSIPIGDRFSVNGKVGGIYGWTETGATAPGVASGKEDNLNWSYGAGLQFDLTRNWAIVGDWDHYRFDFVNRSDDVEMFSIGAMYKF